MQDLAQVSVVTRSSSWREPCSTERCQGSAGDRQLRCNGRCPWGLGTGAWNLCTYLWGVWGTLARDASAQHLPEPVKGESSVTHAAWAPRAVLPGD